MSLLDKIKTLFKYREVLREKEGEIKALQDLLLENSSKIAELELGLIQLKDYILNNPVIIDANATPKEYKDGWYTL